MQPVSEHKNAPGLLTGAFFTFLHGGDWTESSIPPTVARRALRTSLGLSVSV